MKYDADNLILDVVSPRTISSLVRMYCETGDFAVINSMLKEDSIINLYNLGNYKNLSKMQVK